MSRQQAKQVRTTNAHPRLVLTTPGDAMWWHRSDLLADHINDGGGSRVGWIQYPDRVHQFLDGDSRMIDLSLRDQIVQHLRRTILHLIDVNGGIEQKTLSAD
jgi:hypothetical protein